jgi:hypothetical protein
MLNKLYAVSDQIVGFAVFLALVAYGFALYFQ